MQADEIIQQKEWHQLNVEEMNCVSELASNEQEYNLLKKMLLVSAEEVGETPVVSPGIKDALMTVVAAGKRSYRKIYQYAAAAAVLIFVVGGIWLWQKKPKDIYVKKTPEVKNVQQTPLVKEENIIKKDSVLISKKTPATPGQPIIARSIAPIKLQKKKNIFQGQQDYAAVSTNVLDQKELLSLVTEIY